MVHHPPDFSKGMANKKIATPKRGGDHGEEDSLPRIGFSIRVVEEK
jgi:hypothetical protein